MLTETSVTQVDVEGDGMSRGHDQTPTARPGKGFLHYVGLGLSAAVLFLVVALAVIVIVIPQAAGATPLTVLTSSMEPSLPPGTLIVVRPVDADTLAIGDVATYQIRSGEPAVITHRISGITSTSSGEREFEFTGDNNGSADTDAVVPEQIQGKVWYSVPLVGFANNAVNGENRAWIIPGAAALLLAYAGFMVASGVRSSIMARRRAARH